MDKLTALNSSLELVGSSKIAILGTNGDGGFPNVKALLNLKHEGLREFWFSTNTSSKRVGQILADSRACIYFVDQKNFMGLMLIGEMQVLQDVETKRALWRDGFEVYYQQGIEDLDYSVLHFVANQGNYYHGLENITFEISD